MVKVNKMAFDIVIGQNRVKKIFSASLNRDRLAHAYLFTGPSGVGKDAMALSMAMSVNCLKNYEGGCGECLECLRILRLEHPGFHLIIPVPSKPKIMKQEKYQEILRERALWLVNNIYMEVNYSPEITTIPIIGIDQIRKMKQDVMLKMIGGGYRVFLISHAECMTTMAANSLLKLLEEPPEKTVIFLSTSNRNRLLPTIISRCQCIRFDPVAEDVMSNALIHRWNINEDHAMMFSQMASGSIQRALTISEEGYNEKSQAAIAFLEVSLDEQSILRVTELDRYLNCKDKSIILGILQFLLIWLHDILYLDLGDVEKIINKNGIERLKEFKTKWSNFKVETSIEKVEQAIDFIEKNVYLPLIIFSLSQDIRKCIH
jgi:DNA polymerase-3 subunit delta'